LSTKPLNKRSSNNAARVAEFDFAHPGETRRGAAGRGETEKGPDAEDVEPREIGRMRSWKMLQYTNGTRRAITGAGLAQLRRRMSAAERACLAADIIDGRVILQGLTAKAVAALAGVSVGSVDRALRLTPEHRAEVCRGDRPLVQPRARAPVSPIDWN